MPLSATTITMSAGVNYTATTDSSIDWTGVTNNSYFYDKTTKLTYFKTGGGVVVGAYDVFTGGTVTGLTATTINVNGVNITGDTYVTGGTYSAGTIDFYYNSGGGFQVLNLYTGETVTISGGTNIQITGSYPSFGVNFTGTTGVDELSELQDVLISGATGGDTLQYNDTTSIWENSKPFWTIDLMDNSSVEFYAVQDVKINTITNIVGSPTITIADDNVPYTS